MRVIISNIAHRGDVRRLWDYCFHDSPEFSDWYFKNRVKDETTLIAVADENDYGEGFENKNRVMAALQMNDTCLSVRGRELKAACIVGVSTWPEYRGNGTASKLLAVSLAEMKKRNIAAASLYPYDYSYYSKAGYAIICDRLRFNIDISELKARMPSSYNAVPIPMRADGKDIKKLTGCIRRCMEPYSGHTVFGNGEMRLRLEEHNLDSGYGYAAFENGIMRAFMLYTIQKDHIEVVDFMFENADSANALLSVLGAHSSTAKTASISVPGDSLLYKILALRGSAVLEPHTMARVVDLQAATDAILKKSSDPNTEACVVKVSDGAAPWNDGNFRLSPSGCEMAKETGGLACDIGTYTQLLFGYMSAEEAVSLGTLFATEPEQVCTLDRLLPKCPVYLHEMY